MNSKFNTVIKTVAIAAAMAFSSASQAAVALGQVSSVDYFNAGATIYSHGNNTGLTTWSLTGVDALAFCIQPDVVADMGASYGAGASYNASNYVKALYETSYGDVVSTGGVYSANNAAAFQLALWEMLDDHNYSTGKMKLTNSKTGFDPDIDEVTTGAFTMLAKANDFVSRNGVASSYNYTAFSAADSQGMLTVSAVPEADTWAMLAVGLGMLGLVGRRKSSKSEKIA